LDGSSSRSILLFFSKPLSIFGASVPPLSPLSGHPISFALDRPFPPISFFSVQLCSPFFVDGFFCSRVTPWTGIGSSPCAPCAGLATLRARHAPTRFVNSSFTGTCLFFAIDVVANAFLVCYCRSPPSPWYPLFCWTRFSRFCRVFTISFFRCTFSLPVRSQRRFSSPAPPPYSPPGKRSERNLPSTIFISPAMVFGVNLFFLSFLN